MSQSSRDTPVDSGYWCESDNMGHGLCAAQCSECAADENRRPDVSDQFARGDEPEWIEDWLK